MNTLYFVYDRRLCRVFSLLNVSECILIITGNPNKNVFSFFFFIELCGAYLLSYTKQPQIFIHCTHNDHTNEYNLKKWEKSLLLSKSNINTFVLCIYYICIADVCSGFCGWLERKYKNFQNFSSDIFLKCTFNISHQFYFIFSFYNLFACFVV